VLHALDAAGIKTASSELAYIPTSTVPVNAAGATVGDASPLADFRRQYQNVGTDTRSRAQNRATVRPDFSNRRNRRCHSTNFRRSSCRAMASLL
jgi:hypothetical protein